MFDIKKGKMARMLMFVILCQIGALTFLGANGDNSKAIEDIVSSVMQQFTGNAGGEANLGALSGILGSVLQSQNQVGGDSGDSNLGALSGLLGSVLQSQNQVSGDSSDSNLGALGGILSTVLQNSAQNQDTGGDSNLGALGGILSSVLQNNGGNLGGLLGQGNERNNGGDILSGLGSLLGNQNGVDPSVLSGLMSVVAQQMTQQQKPQQPTKQKRQAQNDELNLEGILGMVSGFLGNKNTASYLPLIMNALNSFTGSDTEKLAHDHKDHASFLPPYLEKLHLYWDLFINSELGKTIWEKSGLKRALKSFSGPDGKISFEVMLKSFENHSFRRHWIKAAATKLTDMVIHIAKPEVYQKYISTAQYFINSFLDTQGLPKSAQFDAKRPEKSIATIVNHVLQKHLDMDTDVTEYVKPAVVQIKLLLKMAESTSKNLGTSVQHAALVDRVTDTLNLEVIEPVLRVYRAYKHSVKAPHCQEHLMCLVNRHHDKDKHGLPGFKAGLTKFSSLVASAALSFQNGRGFWDLYNAIQNDVNCEAKYPADCAAFHEHEMKVTTEVYHSEL